MPDMTLLSINSITIPDAAARGITVTLQPEETGALERDVNANLHDLTIESFRKYRVTIACSDMEAPMLSGIFRGAGPYTVTLIPNLGVSNNSDETLTLSMLVDTWQTGVHEWDAVTDWSVNLIEV